MINFDLSSPRGNGAADELFDSQQIEADCCSDNINNRIDSADFVKVDMIDRRTVHLRFGRGDRMKDSLCEFLLGRRDGIRFIDELDDVAQMAVRMLRGMLDVDLDRPERPLDYGFNPQPYVRQTQRIDSALYGVGISAGIDEGAERHVATDSHRAVEPGNPHSRLVPIVRGEGLVEYFRQCCCALRCRYTVRRSALDEVGNNPQREQPARKFSKRFYPCCRF